MYLYPRIYFGKEILFDTESNFRFEKNFISRFVSLINISFYKIIEFWVSYFGISYPFLNDFHAVIDLYQAISSPYRLKCLHWLFLGLFFIIIIIFRTKTGSMIPCILFFPEFAVKYCLCSGFMEK